MKLLPVAALLVSVAPLMTQAQVWRCETDSGVPMYQNSGGPRCKPLDLPVITTIPAPNANRPGSTSPPRGASGAAATPGGTPAAGQGVGAAPSGSASGASAFPKVDPAEQRMRDQERRSILSDELRKEETRIAELRAEYRDGEPERRGDERNYQKYLDRVQRLKDDIARTESAIASLKRELAGLRD